MTVETRKARRLSVFRAREARAREARAHESWRLGEAKIRLFEAAKAKRGKRWFERMRRHQKSFKKRGFRAYYHTFKAPYLPIFRLNSLLFGSEAQTPLLPRFRLCHDITTIDHLIRAATMTPRGDHSVTFRDNGISATTTIDLHHGHEGSLSYYFFEGYKGGAWVDVFAVMRTALEHAGKRVTDEEVKHLHALLMRPRDTGGQVLEIFLREDVVKDMVYPCRSMG
jgi:hypothetical protein